MADEITISARIRVQNGQYDSGTLGVANEKFDQTTNDFDGAIVSASTTAASVTPSVATEGWAILRNLSTGVSVNWGSTNGRDFRMLPKEPALLRLKSGTKISYATTTSTANVQYQVFSN